jgi:hypothetical protein
MSDGLLVRVTTEIDRRGDPVITLWVVATDQVAHLCVGAQGSESTQTGAVMWSAARMEPPS